MSSGITGQTSCVTTSRWDQPAQPKPRVDVMQACVGNSSHPPSSATTASCTSVPTNANTAPNRVLGSEEDRASAQGGVEMAAAMAAKINAMLMAKGKLKTPPPLLSKLPPCLMVSSTADETVITEVDINDVPINCRNLLTKGKTQEEIRQYSGAVVSTKGHYMSDVEKGKGVERPLYLHVQGKSQEEVHQAVKRIKEIISEDVLRTAAALGGQQVPIIPPLTLYPQPPRPTQPPRSLAAPHMPRMPSGNPATSQGHRPAAPHSGSFVHTKIFVGLDQALPSFGVNEKVEGPGGTYLGHIQTETGARVFLRGKGSGYIEQASRRESFEPLYVYISHPNQTGLEAAKKLTESLLETVRAEHSRMLTIYTATGSTQPYAAHGFPPNSNYSSQGSWYNYPVNGYAGGYTAHPGPSGYWSSANGPPSHSNLSTTPQSSQAMVQYPVCPRNPHPYLVQDTGSRDSEEDSSTSPPHTGSPKRRFQEEAQDDVGLQAESRRADAPAGGSGPPPSSPRVEGGAERMLMPPPPLPAVPLPPPTRKRARDVLPVAPGPGAPAPLGTPPAPLGTPPAPLGAAEEETVKKTRVEKDPSGLVPYGGDSSDEEEERARSSKMANS